ncbi:MAG: DsbA family protein, partial [Terriglobia bacterium]
MLQKVVGTVNSLRELTVGRYGKSTRTETDDPLPPGGGALMSGDKSPRTERRCPWLPMLGFMILLAAAWLPGAPRLGSVSPSPAPKCATTSSAQPPNAPLTAAQGAAILSELRAIHLLLQQSAAQGLGARRALAPTNVKMRVEPGWHGLGRSSARVTLVEFTDLQCPVCRRFQTTTFAEIKKDFIDTGKINFITRDLPLPMHAYALAAAEATRCAGDQGKFWQFRGAVLGDAAPPAPDVLSAHAKALGLNVEQFQTCLTGAKYNAAIQADRADAAALGIRGTPGFVIGRADGRWIDGLSMIGARPFPFFEQQIDDMLRPAGGRRRADAADAA